MPHINVHATAVTLELIMWAKRSNLKAGFIFYDAIPLRRAEFDSVLPLHKEYMQHLLLADVVWPITEWAAADLKTYWYKSEFVNDKTMPAVNTQVLPGESLLSPRVKKIKPTKKIILSVGSIEPRKNQIQLMRSFLEYCECNPETEWRLILVGHIHESVCAEVSSLCQSGHIEHFGYVNDNKLYQLYSDCSFTVFPSVEEGYGLPIMESLWFGKPCICANFGSMNEIAKDGGCVVLDPNDGNSLKMAIEQLIEDSNLLSKLTDDALKRPIKKWYEYSSDISRYIDNVGCPAENLEVVYFWIDSTLEFHKNTGIQRVTRQLAKSFLQTGMKLVPVKWGGVDRSIVPVSKKELDFFSKWNGPDSEMWTTWVDPKGVANGWFFMPELPVNLNARDRKILLKSIKDLDLYCASIFFDAIPWKMSHIYPEKTAKIHREYMLELYDYDLVFPISYFSGNDLLSFLGGQLNKPQSLDQKIKAVSLAGELSESPRLYSPTEKNDKIVRIASIGTVEPRKNHGILLEAFIRAQRQLEASSVTLQLIIAGGSQSFDSTYADRIRSITNINPNIFWEEHADDPRLKEIYKICDFTIYPSVEEGFGLPILESLWHARPSICANFGAMKEVAEDGGCYMVDVRSEESLSNAICRLATDENLYSSLVNQSITRKFKSWTDYAIEIATHMVHFQPYDNQLFSQLLPVEEVEKRAVDMSIEKRPLLSVCVSTYNRAEWLAVALRNWTSNYPNPLDSVEFIVCDNASTDSTNKVVKPYLNRSDFFYYKNKINVGMLGNLRETAHHANGQYIWILGDDDLILPGSIERIVSAIENNPEVALVYLNYAFTREEDARNVKDFETFYAESTPIVPAEDDIQGLVRTIAGRNENFFTAIYTLVFRRDHALRAYSQDTSGRPFSTMLTCIPTTHYVLNNMMDEHGVWIGTPQLVINMNVSWMKYASLWILERLPEAYEVAERNGAPSEQVDCWRSKYMGSVMHYFEEIFYDEESDNAKYFEAERLVRRIKHLSEYEALKDSFKHIYHRAHSKQNPAALNAPDRVFPE